MKFVGKVNLLVKFSSPNNTYCSGTDFFFPGLSRLSILPEVRCSHYGGAPNANACLISKIYKYKIAYHNLRHSALTRDCWAIFLFFEC